ncbi:MAG: hypothetical protein WKF97_13955 [Chitinophagaceae bacterium]
MKTQHTTPEHEIHLESKGFVQHMESKEIERQRDLLILEIASRLKLDENWEYELFIGHCRKLRTEFGNIFR